MKQALANYLESQSQIIEQALDRLVPLHHHFYQILFESARHALLGGGKRLRPILTLATVQMLGGDLEVALKPACTLEMVHTYSMIHDDLPCMDDDDYRRGKLTVHKKYNEAQAVLTGDFLLTYAFELLAKDEKLTPLKRTQLITILASSSGSEGMIGGQVMDILSEGKHIDLETLRLLHRNKTASLITAALEFGAVLADAPASYHEALRRFGEALGLAFQVVDDILDVTDSQTKHGKGISSDLINKKSTYVTLLGLEQAKAYAMNFYGQAVKALKPLTCDTSTLIAIADFVINRKY